ncbi:MAG TPA: hypothetical protein VGG27_07380 [Magnetospirillaceae bacterium]
MVEEVRKQLEAFEHRRGLRKRRRKPKDQRVFEQSVTAIVSDLMYRELTEPGGSLAVSLSNEILGRPDRYASPVLSKAFKTLLTEMSSPAMDWLTLTKGQKGHFGTSRLSTIKATERLLRYMGNAGIGLEDIGRTHSDETIILKDEKEDRFDRGERVDYEETADTLRYRADVQRINDWLAQAEIDFDDAVAPGKSVDIYDRRLRRIFNNNRFDHGGRLYGGFWQNLKKSERAEGILIDGEAVVILDLGQTAARILYGIADARLPEGDLYSLPELIGSRDGVKKLLNAAIYADCQLERYPPGTKTLMPRHLKFGEAIGFITAYHHSIAHLFFSGLGLNVMFRESQIMVDTLLRLIDHKIVALPIHDAIVVSRTQEMAAKAIMSSVFRDHTGVEAQVKVEAGDDGVLPAYITT